MKFLTPALPLIICLSLIGAVATFIAGTLIFLVTQAFFDIRTNHGVAEAYIWITAGILVISCICYFLIRTTICYINKKRTAKKPESIIETAKIFVGIMICEALKKYLDKDKK